MELMVSALLHKTDDTPWASEELAPIRDLRLLDVMPSGSVMGAYLTLADGATYVVDFKEVDGFKAC